MSKLKLANSNKTGLPNTDIFKKKQIDLKRVFSKKAIPYLLLLPAFIYYAIFWLAPVFAGVAEVFTDVNGQFTLTGNFKLMMHSDLFDKAVMNTALFAAVSVMIQYFIALLLAVLLSRKFRGAKLFMFIAMIPMAITPTAVAILWKTGLIKEGWINSLLMFLHIIKEPIVFLNAEGLAAVFLIILIDTWTVTPSVMIILLAGLQGMQRELKEAAYTFGANKWRIFVDITLPILKPSIITSIILRLIAAIQVWAIAVMVLGFNKVPFLVERIAFYVDAVPGVATSEKLAFTFSFTTTVIVFMVTIIYLKFAKRNTKIGGSS
ncbi:multiple sugar transport system permease protein [Geosporobacter subterraneus DSM 17957]|uniref:Multiple sugar transport system permease protein n=1 Tax=Geosporobacter subterraneus DSM 17957 TaxID=1121919 RepID=A0A1M6MMD5_9FIRM|nr:sugar ABC transporter permease [Geosporobacter subterraneus]SHJ84648.1 multiple sugar transport system permease protein [Geosporobacter subterraneus DSM 17957]